MRSVGESMLVSRRIALLLLSALLGVLSFVGSSTAAPAADEVLDPTLEADIAEALNGVRADAGLAQLSLSPQLTRSARSHALSMAKLGYFGHSSPNGTAAPSRIASFYPARRSGRWAVGEIILWRSGSVSASKALDMWLGSAPHRRDLLAARWRDVGVAVVHQTDAQGAYGGFDVTIVVVDFGAR